MNYYDKISLWLFIGSIVAVGCIACFSPRPIKATEATAPVQPPAPRFTVHCATSDKGDNCGGSNYRIFRDTKTGREYLADTYRGGIVLMQN